MARPKKEPEIERNHIITFRMSDQALENANAMAEKAGLAMTCISG